MTCEACGHEGHDVTTRIVEANSERQVRIQGVREVYTVPERFRAEARCIDKEACRERQLARDSA